MTVCGEKKLTDLRVARTVDVTELTLPRRHMVQETGRSVDVFRGQEVGRSLCAGRLVCHN